MDQPTADKTQQFLPRPGCHTLNRVIARPPTWHRFATRITHKKTCVYILLSNTKKTYTKKFTNKKRMEPISETKHDNKELDAVKRELHRPILVPIRRESESEPISIPDLPSGIEKPFHSNKPTWSVDAFDKNHPIPPDQPLAIPPPVSSSTPQPVQIPCPECAKEKKEKEQLRETIVDVNVHVDEETQTPSPSPPYLCQLSWLFEPTNWPSWVRAILCVNMN